MRELASHVCPTSGFLDRVRWIGFVIKLLKPRVAVRLQYAFKVLQMCEIGRASCRERV